MTKEFEPILSIGSASATTMREMSVLISTVSSLLDTRDGQSIMIAVFAIVWQYHMHHELDRLKEIFCEEDIYKAYRLSMADNWTEENQKWLFQFMASAMPALWV